MREPVQIGAGIVRATLINSLGDEKPSPSREQESIFFSQHGGIEHDRFGGNPFRTSGAREREAWGVPRGTRVPNWREFSAVSVEDLAQIASNLGLPGEIPYGSLAENLVIEGIPGFSHLPGGTMLRFAGPQGQQRAPMLMVIRTNTPCGYPGGIIQKLYRDVPDVAKRFAAENGAAEGLRGVVGTVFLGGLIYPGDTVIALG